MTIVWVFLGLVWVIFPQHALTYVSVPPYTYAVSTSTEAKCKQLEKTFRKAEAAAFDDMPYMIHTECKLVEQKSQEGKKINDGP